MGTKWHHFRHYVENGEIKILPIDTDDQPADMLSKPLSRDPFEKHRDFIMGWPRSPDERECEDIADKAENNVTVNLDQTGSSYQVPDEKPVLVSILRKSRYSAQERDPVGPGLEDLD